MDNNYYDQISDFNVLRLSYKFAHSKSRYSTDSLIFSLDKTKNILILKQELDNGTYVPLSNYNFYVYEPKERLISAPRFKDKIVQLSIFFVLREYYEPKFIYDSYGCIRNKGTHRAINRLQKFINESIYKYKDVWVLKIDIKKFFYTVNRIVLFELICKSIKCQKTRELILKFFDSVPDDRGLPLGWVTSQLFSNILMNELDQYCKHTLKIKYYMRYMDDIIMLLPNKNDCKIILNLLEEFINYRLDLNLNTSKTHIYNYKRGLDYLGFKVFKDHILVLGNSKRRGNKRLNKFNEVLEISDSKKERTHIYQSTDSFIAHINNADSYNLINYINEKYPNLKILNKEGRVLCLEDDF